MMHRHRIVRRQGLHHLISYRRSGHACRHDGAERELAKYSLHRDCRQYRSQAFSGLALVAEGFMLDNNILTTAGTLIVCSGSALTFIMVRSPIMPLPPFRSLTHRQVQSDESLHL